jgi:hypothetical protein
MRARTRNFLIVALLVVAGAAAGGYAWWESRDDFDPERLARYYSALQVKPAEPVDPQRVREAIALATDYLRRITDENGRFTYLVNMDPSVSVDPRDYNIVRHAGTIYSLAMSNEVLPDPRTVEVMQRASAYMRQCCVTQFEDGQMSAVWDPPKNPDSKKTPSYKLGGAGLGLVALAKLEQIAQGSVPLEELERLARFGQYMQMRSGEFYSNYRPSKGGRADPSQVLFYPGEMALGWLNLYQVKPSDEWIDDSLKGLTYLAELRADTGESESDHWALLSTAELFDVAGQAHELPRELLINHSLQISHAMLERSLVPQPLPEMEGALFPNGVVTPTSTSLEGLLAALRYLPADHPIVPHIESAAHRGIEFLVRAQVRDGPYAGALPHAISRLPDDGGGPRTAEFNRLATEVRIDYVQHAMSAMIQYLQWIESRR